MQFWKLKVNPDNSAVLTCERDTDDIACEQKIPYTDFPIKEIRLYLINMGSGGGVLMLPSSINFSYQLSVISKQQKIRSRAMQRFIIAVQNDHGGWNKIGFVTLKKRCRADDAIKQFFPPTLAAMKMF
nr:DUF6876 family protein [Microcystis aeruginosa]